MTALQRLALRSAREKTTRASMLISQAMDAQASQMADIVNSSLTGAAHELAQLFEDLGVVLDDACE